MNSALDSIDRGLDLFRKCWYYSLVFQDSIKFLVELNYVFMSKVPSPPLQMDSWIKFFEASIYSSFWRRFKIPLPFLFEVFWVDNIMYIFDYVNMNSVLKMNFLLNIYPYSIPVINMKNSYL